MKNSEYKVNFNREQLHLYTCDDLDAIHVFKEEETETIRDAFIALNGLYHGEPLRVSAEFCKNARAAGRLSKDGLDVWLNLWTVDVYNNRVIHAQACLTDTFDITDSEQGRKLIDEYGLVSIYNLQ